MFLSSSLCWTYCVAMYWQCSHVGLKKLKMILLEHLNLLLFVESLFSKFLKENEGIDFIIEYFFKL